MENQNLISQIDTILTLKPNSAMITKRWTNTQKTEVSDKSKANLLKDGAKSEDMNGYLSDASRRKLKGLTENFLTAVEMTTGLKYGHVSKVYPTFITLTLPFKQMHHDNLIKDQCLGPFIEWLKCEKTYVTQKGKSKGLQQGCNVKSYVWRAETQLNGNIHFHLILDRWIDKDQIRWKWNQLIERLGYITFFRNKEKFRYRRGFCYTQDEFNKQKAKLQSKLKEAIKTGELPKYLPKSIEADFINALRVKKFGGRELSRLAVQVLQANYDRKVKEDFSDPPSTQVIPIANARSVTAYVTKYVAKSPIEMIPKLQQGQVVEKVADKYTGKEEKFIVTYRTEEIDGNKVNFEIAREPYIIKFETRKVQGRLWGRSDTLHGTAEPYKVVAYTAKIYEVVNETKYFETKKELQYQTDMLGNYVTTGYKAIKIERTERETVRKITGEENPVVWAYIDKLRQVVGIEEIKAATDRVGGTFAEYGGEIIPVYTKISDKKVEYQRHFLEKYNSVLFDSYKDYYVKMFEEIYGNP